MSIALFERLGRWTWDRLQEGEKLSIRQGETTLTESLLLEVKIRSPGRARVFRVPHSWEAKIGADFDLFVRFAFDRWARFVVQAKKLNGPGTRYDSLEHAVDGHRQIDLLRSFASTARAYPLYGLYNQLDIKNPSLYWHCPKKVDRKLFGWTVTPADVVASALENWGCRTFEFIHEDEATVPIRCLLEHGHAYRAFGYPVEEGSASEDAQAKVAANNRPQFLDRPPRWLEMAEETGELTEPPPEYLQAEPAARPAHVMVVEA